MLKEKFSVILFCICVYLLHFANLEIVVGQPDYNQLRQEMIEYQIRQRGISDTTVLNAMNKVKRHLFVPIDIQHLAYNDSPLPIGYNQTISQPYIVAFMTEALKLDPADKVLEVGTGSGYQAAILGEICDSVYTVEVVPVLGDRSKKLLRQLGYSNIKVRIGDGYKGWHKYAPFDAIIVTCAPTHIPQPLIDQLKEGGKMIIPVGDRSVQELVLLRKKAGKLRKQSILPVIFVPMMDSRGKEY